MCALSRVILASVLAGSISDSVLAEEDLSAAFQEIAVAYRREVAAVASQTAENLSKVRLETIQQLQAIQDSLCRDAKLDEAIAVRDRIRVLTSGSSPPAPSMPPVAAEIVKAFEIRAESLERKAIERVEDAGRRAADPLRQMVDQLCREGRLDEAVEARELLHRLTGVVTDVRPDPGYLRAEDAHVGDVWYFEVVGAQSGSIYGTDIYTSDSSLATAAVHSGALALGEKGIVKVSILPGQPSYTAATRHDVTSSSYGQWNVSFKVERAYVVVPTWR
jgi:hypothetical protein